MLFILLTGCEFLAADPDVDTSGGDVNHEETFAEEADADTDVDTDTDTDSRSLVFVTSVAYTGKLGGLNGADSLCNTHAAGAGLPGAYRAWLSTNSVDAGDRIEEAGPWFNTFGQLVFNNASNLRTVPVTPVDYDELGDFASGAVWTGTAAGGAVDNWHCDGWTNESSGDGTVGDANAYDQAWTDVDLEDCWDNARLLCLQQ